MCKQIKTIQKENDFWSRQHSQTPWCQTCLFLMSGTEFNFLLIPQTVYQILTTDSTWLFDFCYSFTYYISFFWYSSKDQTTVTWRFFYKNSTLKTHSGKLKVPAHFTVYSDKCTTFSLNMNSTPVFMHRKISTVTFIISDATLNLFDNPELNIIVKQRSTLPFFWSRKKCLSYIILTKQKLAMPKMCNELQLSLPYLGKKLTEVTNLYIQCLG